MEVYRLIISIIVPVYKTKKELLKKCLNSLINQTASKNTYEVILVDDNNNLDECGEICKNYALKNENFRAFHQPNSGVSQARNLGIKQSNGKYISFVDSDDFVDENMISIFLNKLKKESFDLIIFAFKIIKNSSNKINFYPNDFKGNLKEKLQFDILASYFHKDFKFNILTCWAKLYKKEIILNNNLLFDKNLQFSEDSIFNLYFIQFCKNIKISNLIFYNYLNINQNSVSNKKDTKIEFKLSKSLDSFEDFIRIYKKSNPKFLQAFNTQFLMLIYNSYKLDFISNFNQKKYQNLVKSYEDKLNSINSKELTFQAKILLFIVKTKSLKILNIFVKFFNLIHKIKK